MNIYISKIKTRRGLDEQRRKTVFDQGELTSTTDTKRLFVGTGTLSGGFVVGSKVHPPLPSTTFLTDINSEIGDLVYVNNKFYQLTAIDWSDLSSWGDVGTKIDPTTFQYDSSNKITLIVDSISAKYLSQDSISGGLKIEDGILQTFLDTNVFQLSSNQIQIKSESITEDYIAASTLTLGLSGGGGSKIQLDVDPTSFYFDGNTLKSYVSTPDNETITTTSGVLSLSNISASAVEVLPRIEVDDYGRVTSAKSSIYSVLEGDSTLSAYNASSPLSTIYNGAATGSYQGDGGITLFTALSNGTQAITLSSAGFITIQEAIETQDGTTLKRFAIPVFAY